MRAAVGAGVVTTEGVTVGAESLEAKRLAGDCRFVFLEDTRLFAFAG